MKNNLRTILVDKGLSLKDINKATGLSVTTVYSYKCFDCRKIKRKSMSLTRRVRRVKHG